VHSHIVKCTNDETNGSAMNPKHLLHRQYIFYYQHLYPSGQKDVRGSNKLKVFSHLSQEIEWLYLVFRVQEQYHRDIL
jgi:hypothetical protein